MDKALEMVGMNASLPKHQDGTKEMCHDTPGQTYPAYLLKPRPKLSTTGDQKDANYDGF